MTNRIILRRRINELRHVLESARTCSEIIQSSVAQSACVSANGHIETYFRACGLAHHRSRCDNDAYRIIEHAISSHYNFKSEKIVRFLEIFIPNNSDKAKLHLKSDERLADAIGSIVGNKNQIAHLGSSNISIARIDGWLSTIVDGLDDLHLVCFGS